MGGGTLDSGVQVACGRPVIQFNRPTRCQGLWTAEWPETAGRAFERELLGPRAP